MSSSAIDELNKFVRDRTGWALSASELLRLYTRYADESTHTVDLARLVDDLRRAMLANHSHTHFLATAAAATTAVQGEKRESSKQGQGRAHADPAAAVTSTSRAPRSFDQLIALLSKRLLQRIDSQRGHDKLHKAYTLLGESRGSGSGVTRAQLRLSLQSRLSVSLQDKEIETLFDRLDPECNGVIAMRALVDPLLARERETAGLSLSFGGGERETKSEREKTKKSVSATASETMRESERETATAGSPRSPRPLSAREKSTRDKPQWDEAPPAACRAFSDEEIVLSLWERVFERSSRNGNMVKTMRRLFSDGQGHERETQSPRISLDAMRYTLWKKLKINIADADIQRFFNKYAKKRGVSESGIESGESEREIDLFEFVDLILKLNCEPRPQLDERLPSTASERQDRTGGAATATAAAISVKNVGKHPLLMDVLVLIRNQLNDLANREGHAPHYLLQHHDRMTADQAKSFFLHKLLIDLDKFPRAVSEALHAEYLLSQGGVFDMKRLLVDALFVVPSSSSSCKSSARQSRPATAATTKAPQTSHNAATQPADKTVSPTAPPLAVENAPSNGFPNGSIATAAATPTLRLPTTVQRASLSPSQIEALLVSKCRERLRTEQPHAALFKILRDGELSSGSRFAEEDALCGERETETERESRVSAISRAGMQRVLSRFDISPSAEEFDAFFKKHVDTTRRGDGRIDVHAFLHRVLPATDLESNPFTPKDPATLRKEQSLALAVGALTGKRREVHGLNGLATKRVETEFLQSITTPRGAREGERAEDERREEEESEIAAKPSLLLLGYNAAPQTPQRESASDAAQSPHHFAAKSPSLAARPSALSPAGVRRRFTATTTPPPHNAQTQDTHTAPQTNTVVSESVKPAPPTPRQEFAEQLYQGQFRVEDTVATETAREKKALAESLVHALRDLSSDAFSTTRGGGAISANGNARAATASPRSKNQEPDDTNARGNYNNSSTDAATAAMGNKNKNKKKSAARPQSAQSTGRSRATRDSETLQHQQQQREEEIDYRMHQSQNLLQLAQAYANSCNVGTPDENNRLDSGFFEPHKEDFPSKPRPSSAPPTRIRVDESLQLFNATDTGMRPAATPDPLSPHPHSFRDTSPRGDRRFTNTGQRQKAHVDPTKEALRNMYKFAQKNCTTSHQEYGLFTKTWDKASKQRQHLYDKQQNELHISGCKM